MRKNYKHFWKIMVMVGILLCAGSAFSSGEIVIPRSDLLDVEFVDDQNGWAVGTRGGIFHTSDGGLHWEYQPIDTKADLLSVTFANASVGWVVGQNGLIFHTIDGGKTWEPQTAPRKKQLLDAFAISTQKCWAIGDWGIMVYTDDGGQTWQDRSYTEDVIFNKVVFFGESEGWVAGEIGTILHTTDGGVNWKREEDAAQDTIFSASFSSEKEGVAVGLGGIILKTEDGGVSWVRKDEGADSEQKFDFQRRGNEAKAIYSCNSRGNRAIAVGDAGTMFYSEDGGNTWNPVDVPPIAKLLWLRGSHMSENGRAYIVGQRSIVFVLENGKIIAWGPWQAVSKLEDLAKNDATEK